MYNITIITGQTGSPPLKLKTANRNVARSVALLCKENDLKYVIVREVEPVTVTFKGV